MSRFESPRQLMSYLGLTPSEYSTGNTRRLGGITKSGNAHARRTLIEGAWAYRYNAKVSREMQQRQETLPKRSVTSPGRPRCAFASATAGSWPRGSIPMSWSWRSHASSPPSCGPSPGKCPLRLILARPGENSCPDSVWTRRECPRAERVDKPWTRSLLPTACPHSFTPAPHCAGETAVRIRLAFTAIV